MHLSKLDPKKFWRKILTCKYKVNDMIPSTHLNSYLQNIYESRNVMDNIPKHSIENEVFSIEGIKFGVEPLVNGKAKDIEGYKSEI
jgi:hypothetical protein